MVSVNAEITESIDDGVRGWVCYDAECALCRRWALRSRRLLEHHGFCLVPLQSPDVRARLEAAAADGDDEMKVIMRSGPVFGGADAVLYLAKNFRWGWPLFALGTVPGMKRLLRSAYRFLARHRTCRLRAGSCAVRRVDPAWTLKQSLGWLPLAVLAPMAAWFGRNLPAWAYMCLLSMGMYAGCKWLTFRTARAQGIVASAWRMVGYLGAWTGMDAKKFFAKRSGVQSPSLAEGLRTLGTIVLGAALIWIVARRFDDRPLWAGWLGMIGAICLLHFGLFQLLSLAWRIRGVDAPPLMLSPARSTSLGELWGVRWNTAFQKLADQFVFRPLTRSMGASAAAMIVFLASGLVHDLIISVPARGGYGLPTAYFLFQGMGVLFERTGLARRCGLGQGPRGWLFTMVIALGPVYWLFHPPFVRNVILPLMRIVGAI